MRPRVYALVLLVLAGLLVLPGCASEPTERGFYYRVRKGDTLYGIGRRYDVSAEALRRVNRISDARSLSVGRKLWIPRHDAASRRRPSPSPPSSPPPVARPIAGAELGWPVSGPVTSGFGRRRGRMHEGLDIGGRRGTVVRSAGPGKVIRSGWLGDYGRIVIVKHVGDYSTVYAHLDRHDVKAGQFVERGQPLGTMGKSGNARGVHLHFEVRRRDAPRNPMEYLPRR